MSMPLSNIRVLDLTNVLAGPFCCHQLAHMGAEVIKVEAVGRGDLARQLGADPELNERGMGVSFLAQNAGKKSITINLKKPEGKELFIRLVKTADVVVENFRPGVMERLGLDYEVIKKANPSIIYCSISGFGQDGPWVHRPAYDQIIQGASGLMSVTGDKDGSPLRAGFPVGDTVGGLTAAFAISAALQSNPRGSMIDISMLESLLATMGWVVSNHLIAGVTPQSNGNENPTSAPSGAFHAMDGLINIAANKDEQWALLANHLRLGELCSDKNFATREKRKENREKLKLILEEVLVTRSARDWAKELNRIGVPSGAVLTVPEVLDMPQIKDRGFLRKYENVKGVDRDIEVVTTGIKLNKEPLGVDMPPPILGQDTFDVLIELGFTDKQIESFRETGVI